MGKGRRSSRNFRRVDASVLMKRAVIGSQSQEISMDRAAAFELLRQFVAFLDEEDYATIPIAEVNRFLDDTAMDHPT